MPIDQRRYSEYASVMNETIRLRTWQKKPTKIDYIRKYRKEGKEEEVLRWPNLHNSRSEQVKVFLQWIYQQSLHSHFKN